MIEEIIVAKKPYLFKTKKVFKEKTIEDKKALRAEELTLSYVEINAVKFDSDEKSMDRMDRVLTIANARFNKLLAEGQTPAAAYNTIYATQIDWKTYGNDFVKIPVSTLVQIQDAALEEINRIWVKWG